MFEISLLANSSIYHEDRTHYYYPPQKYIGGFTVKELIQGAHPKTQNRLSQSHIPKINRVSNYGKWF
jgi:hypothetical protein